MITSTRKFVGAMLKSRKLNLIALSLVAFSAATGFTSYEYTKDSVTLELNGEKKEIRTHADTVEQLLTEQELKVSKYDELHPEAETKVTDDMNVTLNQAQRVALTVGKQKRMLRSTARTVDQLLTEQKINVTKFDEVTPALSTELKGNLQVAVDKAIPVTVVADGETRQVWSTSTTVADFLKTQHIKLNEYDRVTPALEAELKSDEVVKVIRVEKVTDVVETPIPYSVVMKKDTKLAKGKKKVVQKGQQGKLRKQVQITKENGKVVATKLLSSKVIQKSRDHVVAVGTKTVALASRNDDVAKEFYVTATAYTAYCSGCSGTTATGLNLRANDDLKVIAVDPRIIPLGTKVYVEGYGYAIAADTGGAIKGYRIDVFIPNNTAVANWGVRRVLIKILK